MPVVNPSLVKVSVWWPGPTVIKRGVTPASVPSTESMAPCGVEFTVIDTVFADAAISSIETETGCPEVETVVSNFTTSPGADVGDGDNVLADPYLVLVEQIYVEAGCGNAARRKVLCRGIHDVAGQVPHAGERLELAESKPHDRCSR